MNDTVFLMLKSVLRDLCRPFIYQEHIPGYRRLGKSWHGDRIKRWNKRHGVSDGSGVSGRNSERAGSRQSTDDAGKRTRSSSGVVRDPCLSLGQCQVCLLYTVRRQLPAAC